MKRVKYTKEFLENLVKESSSWAEVTRKCSKKTDTGSQTYIAKKGKEFGIDFSHFKQPSWTEERRNAPKLSLEDYLVNGSKIHSHTLRLRLIKSGLKKYQCEECLNVEWNNKPIPLELEHVNGVHDDNRLENLRILCPNCHAQTTTYCRIKKRV